MSAIERAQAIQPLEAIVPQNIEVRNQLEAGLANPTFGPYLQRMIPHAADLVRDGTLDGSTAIEALVTTSELFVAAGNDYESQENHLTGEALRQHQQNVMSGNIVLIPSEYAVSRENSIAQVRRAERTFEDVTSSTQAAIAQINYSTFWHRMMASAAHTLTSRELNHLLDELGSKEKNMPHLTASNWAIGQTVAGMYEFAGLSDRPVGLRIFDIGSGQGATTAAITNSLSLTSVDDKPPLSITGLEATRDFYEEYVNFVQVDEGRAALGLEPVEHWFGGEISKEGEITTVFGDAVESLQSMELSPDPTDIIAVVGNYSWHRLATQKKTEIMRLFNRFPNVIFVIGDLANNTSAVNRRFLNIGVNGPLNPGNIDLVERFRDHGYVTENLHYDRPFSLDPLLADRLRDDEHSDGHLWIAHSNSQLTAAALNLV